MESPHFHTSSIRDTWHRVMMAPTSKKTRGARIRSRFRSINAHDEQKRLKLIWIGYFAKIQKHHCGAYSQWWSAYKRRSTSIRSRSKSIRDSAITWRNACCCRLENSAKTTDIPMSGSAVKNHGWPKRRRQLHAKLTTSYLLLFQGYPPVLGAIRHQHRHRRICLQTSPAQERSDGLAPREWCGSPLKPRTKKERDYRKKSDDRLRDLPEWLEETDNLGDTELLASAPSSQDSDSERPTTVVSKSRKHSIYTHFSKKRKLRSLLANQMTRAPFRRRNWQSSASRSKVRWLDNGWSQLLVRCRGTRSCYSVDSILSV